MNSTVHFHSHLAKPMAQFVKLKQLSGFDYSSPTKLLQRFDGYLSQHSQAKSFGISKKKYEQYLDTLQYLQPRTIDNHITVLRQFFQYLSKRQSCPLPPLHKITPHLAQPRSLPYIYSRAEVSTLLRLLDSEHLVMKSQFRSTLSTFLALLYTTGIRVGEARALNLADVDLDKSLIHVRAGKYHKARWLYLSLSMAKYIAKFMSQRIQVTPNDSDSPLFMSSKRQRVSHSCLNNNFHKILDISQITGYQRRPKMRDLRHSFAVTRLLQWYREGKDVNSKLPRLATYMGHVDISSTQVYLHATVELMAQAEGRFYQYYKRLVK